MIERVAIVRDTRMLTTAGGEDIKIYEIVELCDNIPHAANRLNFLSGGMPGECGMVLVLMEIQK